MEEYMINCALPTGEPFTVSIPKNRSLTGLKKEIKEEVKPFLNDFSPLQLILYKVNLDGSNEEYIKQIKHLLENPANLNKIQPLSMVSMVFPEQPDLSLQQIHILVVPLPRSHWIQECAVAGIDIFVQPGSPSYSTPKVVSSVSIYPMCVNVDPILYPGPDSQG